MRLNVEIPPELNEKMETMPPGTKSSIIRNVLEMIADSAEKNGPVVWGAILSGQFEIVEKKK